MILVEWVARVAEEVLPDSLVYIFSISDVIVIRCDVRISAAVLPLARGWS